MTKYPLGVLIVNDYKQEDDNMTRYRLKTLRKIEEYLRESGPQTIRHLALTLEMDERVVRNYLRTHKGVFEKTYVKAFKQTEWGLKND